MKPEDRALERHGEAFLQNFEAIRRALALYPPNHPNVTGLLKRFLDNLRELRAAFGDATVNVLGGEFYVNGVALKRLSLAYEKNIAAWEKMRLGFIRFQEDVTAESILRFFEVIGRGPAALEEAGGAAVALEQARVHGIRAARAVAEVAAPEEGLLAELGPVSGVAPTSVAEARSRFRDSLGELSTLVEAARRTAGSAPRLIRSLSRSLESRLLERRPVRDLLRELERHDEESYAHALRGAMVAVLMGDVLGLGREALARLGEAAALRDVGLLESPREALVPGAGGDAEKEYRLHPIRGARLLLEHSELDATAAVVALEHHARFDGAGFPRLRAQKGSHAFSRIVAVASDYDWMTSHPAGDRRSAAEAVRHLVQGAGTAYDPAAVRALLRVGGFVPEGTAVTLRDGSYGVVAGPGKRSWLSPEVALLRDRHGAAVDPPRVIETDPLGAADEAIVVRSGAPAREDARRLRGLRLPV